MSDTGRAQRLLHISLNVADLTKAESFYTTALGFCRLTIPGADPALATLLGVGHARVIKIQRGRQILELVECEPRGAAYRADTHSNDLWFQHCALVTDDITDAYARLCTQHFTPISRNGPQTLPGGIVAYKFLDPDFHPLELIQFPTPNPETAGGIDHSAIAVADADRSIFFYEETLGLTLQSRQVNTGPAQDAMDDLHDTRVDVVALSPTHPSPHLELLGYRQPPGRPAAPSHPSDIAATRLVFGMDGHITALRHDPDGHALLLLPDAGQP